VKAINHHHPHIHAIAIAIAISITTSIPTILINFTNNKTASMKLSSLFLSFLFVKEIHSFVSFPQRLSKGRHLLVASDSAAVDKGKELNSNDAAAEDHKIRPLHQNWWPVSTTFALDKTRPNSVELLNQKLVVFWSESDQTWTCLDDRCSHRFAPLSEGRIVSNNCLQCAYHGWEFDSQGRCQKVPQAKSGTGGRNVQKYPVQVQASMIFVWADPDSYDSLGTSTTIPMFPRLETTLQEKGDSACFMRDLPYGYELLGENLLDLSHLPFSHHGVGGLQRKMGGELPFKMLSASQRSQDQPLFEAFLEHAGDWDPLFKVSPRPVGPEATLNLGFYDPCHVRYTRRKTPGNDSGTSYVALYVCPTSSTKSRVFLFNVAPKFEPMGIKGKLLAEIIKRKFTPVFSHQISHKIFDGDGIFLHKQGDRMQRLGLNYKDYHTPAAADVMVNAFRRYNDVACKRTAAIAGLESMAEAAMPPPGSYKDNLPRSQMLDRYESHTKNCKICSAALKSAQQKQKRLQIVQTALIGATGVSLTTLMGSALWMVSCAFPLGAIPSAIARLSAATSASLLGASMWLSKRKEKRQQEIQQFLFEDYIHAEKD